MRWKGVLFLCGANSCRSQMAEGYYRSVSPRSEVYSAGTDPGDLHPLAVRVMREIGVDISSHRAKGLPGVPLHRVDTVVTLCGAAARCPVPEVEAQRIHWSIPDPAAATGSEEELLEAFRHVRDDIRARVLELIRSRGIEA